jgi:DsbC/DsbD-like thiol-disulfide interchange protein
VRTLSRRFFAGARDLMDAAVRATLCLAIVIALGAIACVRSGTAATTTHGTPVAVHAGNVEAQIVLSADRSSGGRQIGVVVNFNVAPGWHIYGEPLPPGEGLTPTSIKFDGDLVAQQKLEMPKPIPLRFETLNETYPVYQGSFKAAGNIVLAQKLKAGDSSIEGTLSFQECNDSICQMPQSVHFALPIKIESAAPASPKT